MKNKKYVRYEIVLIVLACIVEPISIILAIVYANLNNTILSLIFMFITIFFPPLLILIDYIIRRYFLIKIKNGAERVGIVKKCSVKMSHTVNNKPVAINYRVIVEVNGATKIGYSTKFYAEGEKVLVFAGDNINCRIIDKISDEEIKELKLDSPNKKS